MRDTGRGSSSLRIRAQHGCVAVALGLALAACSGQGAGEGVATGGRGGRGGGGRGAGGGPPVPVVTARAEQRSVPVTLPAVGTAEPISSVQVRAQVTGQVAEIHFSEGQTVRKGQPLFTLDSRPFEVALQQAQAVLARDTAQAQNAESQQKRYEDLFNRGLIPRDQYETQRAGAASLQATLQADRAAVENAKLNLQYTRITSPIAGRTGAFNVHVGDLVRANDTQPMVVINQLSPIYVTFAVPGRYLGEVRRYQAQKPLQVQARETGPSNPDGGGTSAQPPSDRAEPATDQGETGTVTFIDNGVDPTTGTIKLKATFANTHGMLWPGQFVQVSLQLTMLANAVVVPTGAVQDSQDGQFVYVVTPDRTAEVRRVQVERQHENQSVIAKGVSVGEEVVTDGQLRLTPGAHVTTAARGEGGRGGAGREGGGRRGDNSSGEGDSSGGRSAPGGRSGNEKGSHQ
jgi:multidrug efflux system membrane fusion protein